MTASQKARSFQSMSLEPGVITTSWSEKTHIPYSLSELIEASEAWCSRVLLQPNRTIKWQYKYRVACPHLPSEKCLAPLDLCMRRGCRRLRNLADNWDPGMGIAKAVDGKLRIAFLESKIPQYEWILTTSQFSRIPSPILLQVFAGSTQCLLSTGIVIMFNGDASTARGQRLDSNHSAGSISKIQPAGGRRYVDGGMHNSDGLDEYINNTLAQKFSEWTLNDPPLAHIFAQTPSLSASRCQC